MYPQVLKTSSSHEEGCIRRWNLASCRFIGDKNILKGVEVEEVEWIPSDNGGRPEMKLLFSGWPPEAGSTMERRSWARMAVLP